MSRILLVRHGQASFGAADYDQLSPTGQEQSQVLGRALAQRDIVPDVLVTGEMRRHVQTADGVAEGLASGGLASGGLARDVHPGWNEFDHLQVLSVHTPPEDEESKTERVAFQRWFEQATLRWTSGSHDADYDESFAAFSQRVGDALDTLVATLPRGGTAVVLTSGGPVAWLAASLLADDTAERTRLWLRLNPVSVNTGVSTVVVGTRGTTLVSFNAHDHLMPTLITYR